VSNYQIKDAVRHSRAQWLEKFETECIKLRPKIRGRVDWNAAHYYYLKGLTPKAAADAWLNQKLVEA
jgi:hypothetical protein